MRSVHDLNNMKLRDAWLSDKMRELRQKHLDDRLEGTVCYNCIHGN